MQQRAKGGNDQLLERCLAAFLQSGSLDVSLDQIAARAGTSKRMLIHYFGDRDNLEQLAMVRLEDQLRARFAPGSSPSAISAHAVVMELWEQTTAPEARGALLLIMDISRRGWSGSEGARRFYEEQQRLWVALLQGHLSDPDAVEELLQLFQGAALVYLVTGDRERGRRSLERFLGRNTKPDVAKSYPD